MNYIETAIGFLFSTLEFALRKLSLKEHFDILISGGCIVVVIKIKTAIMKERRFGLNQTKLSFLGDKLL